ncbi:MAG: FAD-binding protein, partial [Chloroflexota bacterium]
QEIEAGRGIGPDGEGIHLDLRHLGRERIETALPQVREIAIDFLGLDPVTDLIPIQPTAHYGMGGIPTDVNGRVLANANGEIITGLYAAGECACVSTHGANRLGSNSLLEASVFGRRAGQAMAQFLQTGAALAPLPGDPAGQAQQYLRRWFDNEGPELVEEVVVELQALMTNKCGVFRDGQRLQEAHQKIGELQARLKRARVMDKGSRFNTDLLAAIEAEHLLNFSAVIVACALNRTESRGAHSRLDFPKRDDEQWLKHTIAHLSESGEPVLSYKSVFIDWERYPPEQRKY